MKPETVSLDRHADFHELSPAIHILPQAPRFQFGTMPAELAALFYRRTRLPASGVFAAGGMEVCRGLLLRAENRLVEAPAINWQSSHIAEAVEQYGLPDAARPARRVQGRCALIVTPGYPIFGHWLADMLPRLGILEAAGYDLDALTYIVTEDTPAFGLELLRLMGIGADRLVTLGPEAPVLPDELLLPTFPHNGRQFTTLMTHAVRLLRARVETRFGPLETGGYPPSILLTRHGWGARRMENRDEYEAMAAAHGFHVVAPETLPMLDQFRMFAGAREVIGEYGSALHSSLFAGAGTVVCALRGTQPHPAFIQSGIGDALDQPTGYVFGQSSGDTEKRGYAVQPADLRACLDTVFGSHRPRLQGGTARYAPPSSAASPPPLRPTAMDVQAQAAAPNALLAPIEASIAQGDHGQAYAAGVALFALAPRTPGLAAILCALAAATDEPKEAIRFAIAAIDQAPGDEDARAGLATLLPAMSPGADASEPSGTIELDFSSGGNTAALLLTGWSRPEPKLTWMIDQVSELKLPLLSAQHDWLAALDATPTTQDAALCLRFNGHELARMSVSRTARLSFRIPREVIANGNPGVLTFEHPDCISPRQLGRSRDPRRLAFATRSLRLIAAASPESPA